MPSVVRIHLRPQSAEAAQLIEHLPSKLRVASLSLVFRSKKKKEYLLDAPFSLLWWCQVLLLNYFLRLPRYSVTSLRKYTMVG